MLPAGSRVLHPASSQPAAVWAGAGTGILAAHGGCAHDAPWVPPQGKGRLSWEPRLKPEKGRSDADKAGESRGQRTRERSSAYLLTSKKFPMRHSTEGTVEAMET